MIMKNEHHIGRKDKNCNTFDWIASHLLAMTGKSSINFQSHDTLAPCGRGQGEGFNPCKKESAFTLAEVLITLGIIGVVAALTIPGLINNYKAARLRSQFLKSYSTVQQAFKQMGEDDVSLNPADYPSQTFYKAFMKYFKGVTDCGVWGGSGKCPKLAGTNYQTINKIGSNGHIDGITDIFDDGTFLLNDGTLIIVENPNNTAIWVHVDLNGYINPPNRMGYDLFTFVFLDGELRTMGSKDTPYTDMSKYCNPDYEGDLNGIACAQKAKENPDYFKELVKKVKM